jgi:4-hydroxybenzoate polyprenyltransferase
VYALSISLTAALIVILACGFYFIYSSPPLRLKRIFIVSKFLVGSATLMAFMLGYSFFTGSLEGFPFLSVIPAWGLLSLSANYIDLKDYAGDRKDHIQTLPVILGMKRARVIIAISCILTYLLIPVFFDKYLFLIATIPASVILTLTILKEWDERYFFINVITTLGLSALLQSFLPV